MNLKDNRTFSKKTVSEANSLYVPLCGETASKMANESLSFLSCSGNSDFVVAL